MPSVMQTINSSSGVGRFHDRVRGERWRHEDNRGVSAGFPHSFVDRVENGPAFVGGTAFAGRNSADNLRAVLRTSLGVKCAFASRQSLHDHAGRFVYKNTHQFVSALKTLNPERSSIPA